ncbi:MAG: NADH-quinone oxidoreductase subunit NuoK [Candidatus Eisenbacteria bacterium]|uniref:NADH-quinone oxidoreductase subunit K n=1 Tax=Eiseniibacteriota bacterium TaxID=2212470 RepID=A0A948S119_UNCEI|nr:NADH-quinone oxidoreductase subunit NuoK [Candidatus Eisenbacteria bacterium]MBU1950292.1 NADH-quinone oxidoreductase subunit NuoK [Candidatus Eisenbacteria bacterium]MBU2692892.1 NADH-quinone oxidoreductase subunit NuoK [Candidatus Eisenbacteria bacterium]
MQLSHYIALSAFLFMVGIFGFVWRRNFLIVLMSVELMLNAVNLALVAFARYWDNPEGHVFTFFVIALAAAEAAVGLSILIVIYRQRESVDVGDFRRLRE